MIEKEINWERKKSYMEIEERRKVQKTEEGQLRRKKLLRKTAEKYKD